MQAAAIAAHRFGWGETSLSGLAGDPRAWVRAQWQSPTPYNTQGLANGGEAFEASRAVLLSAAQVQAAGTAATDSRRVRLRTINRDSLHRRWQHVVTTRTPVYERWVQFWSNHLTVSATKAAVAGLVWAFENEAIRPHAQGRFPDMLKAAVLHPAMLLYLDNAQSIGPDSPAGQRRARGLNENLARELLELHTLGVNGGYTQTDVTEAARILTGWTVRPEDGGQGVFVARQHQPGRKTVLGTTYPEGPEALDQLLANLCQHPACAAWVARKLVTHFVTDTPPPALVDAVAKRFVSTEGDMGALWDTLFGHDLAWRPEHPPKFKRPEELVLSAHRQLQLPMGDGRAFDLLTQEVQAMGQPMGRVPSPQGWADTTSHWLSPDALFKRVAWAGRFAQVHTERTDVRGLARMAMGPDLQATTREQVDRAESGAQAMALWLSSPDFQWR